MVDTPSSRVYCANHPERETLLRCNRCEKPICYQCAVQTPVGYRCRQCIRQQQAKYYNAEAHDLPLAAIVALGLGIVAGALASLILGSIGWFRIWIALIAGPFVGGIVAEAVRRVVRRRRAPGMKWAAAIAALVGVIAGSFLLVAVPALLAGAPAASLLAALPLVIFRLDILILAALTASTVYARLL